MMREPNDSMPSDERDDRAIDDLLRSANASIGIPDHLPGRIAGRIARVRRRRRRIVAGSCAGIALTLGAFVAAWIAQGPGIDESQSTTPQRIARAGDQPESIESPIESAEAHDQKAAGDNQVYIRFPEEAQVFAHRIETEDPNITIIMIYDRVDTANVKSINPDHQRNTSEEGTSS